MTNLGFWPTVFVSGAALIIGAVLLKIALPPEWTEPVEELNKPDATAALNACKKSLKALASHPSTVNFHWTGNDFTRQGEGWLVKLSFSAKNSYGLEADMVGLCAVGAGDAVLWADAQEAR